MPVSVGNVPIWTPIDVLPEITLPGPVPAVPVKPPIVLAEAPGDVDSHRVGERDGARNVGSDVIAGDHIAGCPRSGDLDAGERVARDHVAIVGALGAKHGIDADRVVAGTPFQQNSRVAVGQRRRTGRVGPDQVAGDHVVAGARKVLLSAHILGGGVDLDSFGQVARDQVAFERVGGPILAIGADQAGRHCLDIDTDVIPPRQGAGDIGADKVTLDHGAVSAVEFFIVNDQNASRLDFPCCSR